MQIPDEFRRFASTFWNGSLDLVNNDEEWIDRILPLSNKDQQAVIKKFIDELLSKPASDAELRQAWGAGVPTYGFRRAEHLRAFLALVSKKIGELQVR